jgi:Domain of unknown function (DUF929)
MSKTGTNRPKRQSGGPPKGKKTAPAAAPGRKSTAAYPRRTQRAVANARRHRRNTTFWVVISLVLVIGIAAVTAVAIGGGSDTSTGSADRAASPAVMRALTGVPADVFSTVGKGSATSIPKAVDAPALTKDGKPRIVFIGAEYCPYCAAERWALTLALSRFGTFSGLRETHSSSIDVYPSTNTLSFHGATYDSPYLAFESVELETNQPSGNGYQPLETPTAEQAKLMATYDAPPYTSTAGSIPFIDFGGSYLSTSATYSPEVLSGKTHQQIADALSDPNSPITQGVVGVANGFTAAICNLTNQQPASVCADPTIQQLAAQLAKG